MHETLEKIQNHLRKQSGKITGSEFQPALELLKKEIEKEIKITREEKIAFDLFFEKLKYKENGKGFYPSLAFLLAAVEFHKIEKRETLKKIEETAKQLQKELMPRMWEYCELFLGPLQKIIQACRDSQSFLIPNIANTYNYEIKNSALSENEKKTLLEYIKQITK